MVAPRTDALVFFGATGDLAFKQIFPALQAMIRHGHLDVPVIGVARRAQSADQLRTRVHDSLSQHGGLDKEAFAKLMSLLTYVSGDYGDPATYRDLKKALGAAAHPLHYLAIPPSMFATVIEGLAKSGCATDGRVVIEKPFGHDLASAEELNTVLLSAFPEAAIFPEQFGVADRGAFYEETGALRDVVQNHMLQVTALLAMEPPISGGHEAIRDETTKVFKAMIPLESSDVVRGQYMGYRQTPGVAPDSQVETFAAVRLHLDMWRWAGVPFYIRAGKCLPVTTTEVVVELKRPPQTVFAETVPGHANHFRFRLSPDVVMALSARVKVPGEAMFGEDVELIARHQPGGDEMAPYERLLGDAMRGDPTLFAREDAIEAAWRVVDPILGNATPVNEYDPDTWGPTAAEQLIAADGELSLREPALPARARCDRARPCLGPGGDPLGRRCRLPAAQNRAFRPLGGSRGRRADLYP
ncbi:MAG: glucose-6-phosphate dehydrogenase (NADP(+)) [Thermomicrobia bacterium]|nr:glucose-6-phosphate dehydrogenase (NADP(+)) [Thermomicrobia bacterium]